MRRCVVCGERDVDAKGVFPPSHQYEDEKEVEESDGTIRDTEAQGQAEGHQRMLDNNTQP